MGQKHATTAIKDNETKQKKLTKRKFKIPYARKNEVEEILSEKDTLSSADRANATEQRNTTLVFRMKKHCALIILYLLTY